MAALFSASDSIKKAVQLINGIDLTRFQLLFTRVGQKIYLKNERTFSNDEEQKLQAALSLTEEELELLLSTCEYFLYQAAYHGAKPAVLGQQLSELELVEEKVKVIVDCWASRGREITDKLRQHSIAPKQLQNVSWRLHLQMGQTNQSRMKQPVAIVGLDIGATQQTAEQVKVEFTHEELYDFYNKLEIIQGQIDALS